MKRHRFLTFSIDSTRNFFKGSSFPHAEIHKRESQEYLSQKYGPLNFEEKFTRWLSIPKPTLSVVDEHTYLLQDIENAYVSGSLYATLTSACCLGERILNQIILRVKNSYKSTSQYKLIYRKSSINNWELGINTLLKWKIIKSETEKKYKQLLALRTDSVHFQNKEQNLVPMAKNAICLINEIISDLFELKREKKFLIWFEVPGELYLKREAENIPFIEAFYIPCAPLVGFKHIIETTPDLKFRVIDKEIYPNKEISDQEFVKLRNKFIQERNKIR